MPQQPKKKKKPTTTPIRSAPKPAAKLGFFARKRAGIRAFMKRRPHRSFRLTRRRDYVRSLKLPGYWAFTASVFLRLREHKWLFILIAVFYALLGVLLGTVTSQATYTQISDLFKEGGKEVFEGSWGTIGQAVLLSLAALNGGSSGLSDVQQVYAVLLFLLAWLTTVWLLRELLAGSRPRARDGIYNSAAPLVSTLLVVAVLLVQLVPVGVLAVVYSALAGIGMLSSGLGAFLFSMLSLVVIALTLYWITSTFIALVVVTLPGMYPMQALRIAGDLVVGRRTRILYRLLWLLLTIIIPWLVIMTPIILFDSWLRDIWVWYRAVPVAPIAAAVMGALSTVWACSYIYLLYRKVVDDDSAPA